jgi:predicted transcriptional regulator
MSRGESWRFLTNHALALVVIDRRPDIRLSDLAREVGVTERTAQSIVADLVRAGYVESVRVGRRSHYCVVKELPFRHPLVAGHHVDTLLDSIHG